MRAIGPWARRSVASRGSARAMISACAGAVVAAAQGVPGQARALTTSHSKALYTGNPEIGSRFSGSVS